jgi:hypothetical protein
VASKHAEQEAGLAQRRRDHDGNPTSQLNIERTWDEGRYTRANVLRELLRTQILAATHSSWPAVRAADQC